MQPSLELDIIEKAKQGNAYAFQQLVEKYQSFAYCLAYRLTGSTPDAEDIVQEAFVRVWKNLKKYKPEIKLSTWLYKIVTNLCLDFLKSNYGKKRMHHASIEKGIDVAAASTPEEDMQKAELMNRIMLIADELTPKQRAAFTLCDLQGLTLAETCDILAISAGNVKSNLYYARKKMNEKLNEFYSDYKRNVS